MIEPTITVVTSQKLLQLAQQRLCLLGLGVVGAELGQPDSIGLLKMLFGLLLLAFLEIHLHQ